MSPAVEHAAHRLAPHEPGCDRGKHEVPECERGGAARGAADAAAAAHRPRWAITTTCRAPETRQCGLLAAGGNRSRPLMEDRDAGCGGVHPAPEGGGKGTLFRTDPRHAGRGAGLGGGESGRDTREIRGVDLLQHQARRCSARGWPSRSPRRARSGSSGARGRRQRLRRGSPCAHRPRRSGSVGDAASASRGTRESRPRAIVSEPTTPMRRPLGAVVSASPWSLAAWCFAAAPAQNQHAQEHGHQAHRRNPRCVRGGPFGPAPHNQLELRTVYLTVVGMPLIWPAFSFANCAATALLIEAGTVWLHLP